MAIGVISASIPVNVGVTAQHQAKFRAAKESIIIPTTAAQQEAHETSAIAAPSTAGISGTGEILNTKA
ncbi:hypothetical protein [Pseudomonas sp.]|uniref:hypothetical protein n=1 Tax=Pseudomonas sp. TaxID=306 RepID=UPI002603386A|nr:hypothetical protein [Pseudomonas sp.]